MVEQYERQGYDAVSSFQSIRHVGCESHQHKVLTVDYPSLVSYIISLLAFKIIVGFHPIIAGSVYCSITTILIIHYTYNLAYSIDCLSLQNESTSRRFGGNWLSNSIGASTETNTRPSCISSISTASNNLFYGGVWLMDGKI